MYNNIINKWEDNKIYKFDTEIKNNIFSIDTPPPTISGTLHIGHVFSYCQADFIARFNRMIGKNVFYPIGYDSNGLPTEKLTEKTLKKRAKDYDSIEEFNDQCKKIVDQAKPEFKNVFQKIGLSIDFDLEYDSMDDRCTKIAIASFDDLQEKNLVYQAQKPTFWDWIDETAIAQAEIEDIEFEGEMHDIIFKSEQDEDTIISTTRPEMLYSCFCIFVHPDCLNQESRYKHLKGKYLFTPLYNKKVPIIADAEVIKEKGTGIMMCCAFGDELDLKRWEKYSIIYPEIFKPLDKIDFAIQKNGKINPDAAKILSDYDESKSYKIEEFRKLLVEELKSKNIITNSIKVRQIIKCAERSGCKLEIIPTSQWYVKILEFKNQLLEEAQKIHWLPKEMFEKIKVWIENLRHDWCISRNRNWGIKIPNSNNKNASQVFDTWFTSSLTPIINALYGQEFEIENALKKAKSSPLFKMDVRPQAHEIIRTWAFYTIAKSYLHFGSDNIPWSNIMISGWCLAKDGGKMSKSKGNITDPVKLLEQYEPDAIRYWSANSNLGADTKFDENTLKIGKKLTHKLKNVVNFLNQLLKYNQIPETNSNGETNIEKFSPEDWQIRNKAKYRCNKEVLNLLDNLDIKKITDLIDIWIMNKFANLAEQVTKNLTNFDYSKSLELIEKFFWNDFCDNYIESCKTRAYGEQEWITNTHYLSALTTLSIIIKNILKLFAIYLPFATEELYLSLFKDVTSIHQKNNWINYGDFINFKNYHYASDGENLIQILEEVRKFKGHLKLSIKTKINLNIYFTEKRFCNIFAQIEMDLKEVAGIENFTVEEYDNQNFDVETHNKIKLKFELLQETEVQKEI
jgi:valyl-tRNA synthetase